MTDQETINRTIDQAWPWAPFDAWDLIAHERVTMLGWYDSSHYRLTTGTIVHLSTITTVIPDWLVRAEAALADAQDVRETQQCALDVAVQ